MGRPLPAARTRSIAARSVRGRLGLQLPCDHGRLEVRQGVDIHLANPDRASDAGDRRAHMGTGPLQQAPREAQPSRRVMVAGGDDDLCTGVNDPLQGLREQGDGVGGGVGPVVDIAGHQDRLNPLRAHDLHQVVEVVRLRTKQSDTVERASQVPVRGVQQPHAMSRHRQCA